MAAASSSSGPWGAAAAGAAPGTADIAGGPALTETVIADARWQAVDLPALAERAARATLAHLGLDPGAWEIAVLGCDDARIAALNADFRGRAQPTNVLSWPSAERGAARDGARPALPVPGADPELGDIAIAYETCLREARAAGIPLADHVSHLLVHATLHLLGWDHVRERDATLMESEEVEILGRLGIANPY
ncbi:MAG: rRNA maturation RNase YbeY [Roseovarius sp.]